MTSGQTLANFVFKHSFARLFVGFSVRSASMVGMLLVFVCVCVCALVGVCVCARVGVCVSVGRSVFKSDVMMICFDE